VLTVIKLVRLIHLLLAKGRRHLLKQTEKTCTIVVHRVEGVSHVTSASDYQSRRRCIGVPQCNVMFIYSSVLHSLMSSSLHFRHLLLPSLLLLAKQRRHIRYTCRYAKERWHIAPSLLSTSASNLLHPLTSCDCSFIVSRKSSFYCKKKS